MKIQEWALPENQRCSLGRHKWSVSRLFELSRNLPILEIPLDHLNLYYYYDKLTLREMVSHIKAIEKADLNMPIILDEDGELMDGRHRLMKALWLGKTSIKAVRFDENPTPCQIVEED